MPDSTRSFMSALPADVRITEVGPRDGLQNEKELVQTTDKIRFVELLAEAGFPEIEVTSFVNPRWVPQLADAAEVLAAVPRRGGLIRSALVPNGKGLERALLAGVDKIAVFTAASEAFSQRNTNATIEESLVRVREVVGGAKAAGLPVRGYVSCVVACPYAGPIEPAQVRTIVDRLLGIGVDEIDLGETIGVAAPADIERLYDGLQGVLAPEASTLHLHDTRGGGLACAFRAMQIGVRSFDASCGGLGGCPFAPGAAGNLATEDLLHLCHRSGIRTGIDREKLLAAGRYMAAALGRRLPGRSFAADATGASASSATTCAGS
ncbi:MAG: hydroxymethylglutaryl-CoA lyase [Phycisphaerales bacterium]|nr:hydroxymethylglutaryl-CoA lyase [Phycisphaerales bacterium]